MTALICITTCKRLDEVKKNIIPFLQFCHYTENYHFLLALDGFEKDYIEFCDDFNIPLIYSDEREGVGISKNRVLKQFPKYDYYFFIEDDIELINSNIFKFHIDLSNSYKIPHFTVANIIPERVIDRVKYGNHTITHASKTAAYFSFYTKKGLEKVGGWNEHFAKYKRFGHTEHTYRFFHAKISPAPFMVVENFRDYILINYPPHVTKISVNSNKNQLIEEEQALIDAKTKFHPITTLSEFHFNNKDVSITNINSAFQKGRYELLKGKRKTMAIGNYYLHKFKINRNPFLLILAIILYPKNNLLRFYLKKKLGLWKMR